MWACLCQIDLVQVLWAVRTRLRWTSWLPKHSLLFGWITRCMIQVRLARLNERGEWNRNLHGGKSSISASMQTIHMAGFIICKFRAKTSPLMASEIPVEHMASVWHHSFHSDIRSHFFLKNNRIKNDDWSEMSKRIIVFEPDASYALGDL
jgi:hypothetical protein